MGRFMLGSVSRAIARSLFCGDRAVERT
ncbi:MAG TPA: hypothetical protein VKZ59_09085 [Acidobacteriota bacterium]|nr:hypothetical protein [Acidobacteriota bacterium]